MAETTNEEVKLLHFWASPFGMRVIIALEAKGVKYELVEQDILSGKSQLLLDSNPVHKKVPVLLHKGRAVAESSVIVEYIDEAWPSPDGKDLLPKDPYGRAFARFWGDFIDKKVFEVSRRMVRTKGEELEKVKEQTIEALEAVERALGGVAEGGPYFGGGRPGYVDVIMAPFLGMYPVCEAVGNFKFQFEEEMPHLHAWIQAVKSSSIIKSLVPPEKLVEFALKLKQRLTSP